MSYKSSAVPSVSTKRPIDRYDYLGDVKHAHSHEDNNG